MNTRNFGIALVAGLAVAVLSFAGVSAETIEVVGNANGCASAYADHFTTDGTPGQHGYRHLSTPAGPGRLNAASMTNLSGRPLPARNACRPSEAERVAVREFAARLAETKTALNVPALDEASRATANAWTTARAAVLLFLARSLADCLAKLQYGLRVRYYGDADDTVDKLQSLADDLARLVDA